MRIDASESLYETRDMQLFDEFGNHVDTAFAFDTDEGWFEMYVRVPGSEGTKFYIDRKTQEMARVRLYGSFEVRNKDTGKVMHRSRWSLSRTGAGDTYLLESF